MDKVINNLRNLFISVFTV